MIKLWTIRYLYVKVCKDSCLSPGIPSIVSHAVDGLDIEVNLRCIGDLLILLFFVLREGSDGCPSFLRHLLKIIFNTINCQYKYHDFS